MHFLLRVNRWIRRLLRVVVVVSIVGLAGAMAIQVFLRYVLQRPLMGIEELAVLFGLWIYFAGLALVSVSNLHIRGGFIALSNSPSGQAIVDRVYLAICALICLYFLWLSLEYTQFVYEVNRRSTYLRWPTVIWVASLNLGLCLSAIALAIQAIVPDRRVKS